MMEQREVVQWASSELVEDVQAVLAFYRDGAAAVAASHPVYLKLPEVIADIAVSRWYQAALPYGRFEYRDEMYEEDEETDEVVYWPIEWTQAEVLKIVESNILLQDRRLAVVLSLAWRVGFVVGWLSGLAVAQPDEAQNGMVLLAALVAPLLVSLRRDSCKA